LAKLFDGLWQRALPLHQEPRVRRWSAEISEDSMERAPAIVGVGMISQR
jgi:hypothetical protein